MININNLDNLDNKRISIIQGQNRQTSGMQDVSLQEVFKQKLDDLKFTIQKKTVGEDDPLMVDIEAISKVMPATSVPKESEAAPKPSTTLARGQQESFGDIEEKKATLRRDLLQAVKGAAPEQEQGKQVDAEKFVKELFEDKLETESWVTANQNMHFIKN